MIDPTDPHAPDTWGAKSDDVYNRIKKQQRRRAFRIKAIIVVLTIIAFSVGAFAGWNWN